MYVFSAKMVKVPNVTQDSTLLYSTALHCTLLYRIKLSYTILTYRIHPILYSTLQRCIKDSVPLYINWIQISKQYYYTL